VIRRYRALLPYVLVLVVAAVLTWKAMHFGFTPRGDRPGPDVWPRAILALIVVTCIIRIATVLRRRSDDVAGVLDDVIAGARPDASHETAPAARFPRLLVTGIALTIAYVALLGTLGFFCDTVLYMVALMRTGRYRRWPVIVAVAVAGALAFVFVFMKIVYLSLPIGTPPFETISLALMRLLGIR
jgi:putative tricarboxylic transport membrane protein